MTTPKPVDTIKLAMSLIDFFKSAAIVLGMTVIEWAKAKQAHAEDQQAVAESELKTVKEQHAIEKAYINHKPHDIVREYLDKGGTGPV